MNFRIAICDDEEQTAKMITGNLEKGANRCGVEIAIRFFRSGREYLNHMIEKWEDIVILDIDMPVMNGLEVAREIRKQNEDIILIFLSAHSEYVFQSFEVQPFRFIRKDMMEIELFLGLRAAVSVVEARKKRYMHLTGGDGEEVVAAADIIYAELWKRRLHFHLSDGRDLSVKMTVRELCERLEGDSFTLLHSGLMVNIAYIRSYTKLDVTLTNNEKLPIARTRADEVKKAVYRYWSRL